MLLERAKLSTKQAQESGKQKPEQRRVSRDLQ